MEVRERKQPQQESLKEKLRVKWNTRDFTPQEDHSNVMSMNLFFFMAVTLLFEALYYLIPRLYPDSPWFVRVVAICLCIETLINWHRSYFDTANYVKPETKEKYFPESQDTPVDWAACIKCQVDRPPRAYHCKYCGKCMLKRVHHCFLTGSCIGFHNQKFFLIFCLWSTISSGFFINMQLAYLSMDLPMNSVDILSYFPPVTVIQFFTGYLSLGQTLLVIHFCLTIVAFLTSFIFFFWQMFLVYEGVTLHEGFKGIYTYSGTFSENIKSVFGSVFYIPVLVFIPYRFEQEGDGIQWKARSKRVKGQ